jgi:membrane-bound ClpP family serine protease
VLIAQSSLELIYWVTLGVGLGLLILSVVLGDVFDFLDIDIGGTDLAIVPMLFTAISAFGAGGLIGTEAFGLGQGGSIITGVGMGVVGGALTGLLFAALRRQESEGAFQLTALIGERGRCTLGIGPSQVGRVSVTHGGMTRTLSASSSEEIASGDEVVVKDVIGSQLSVARPMTAEEPA